MSDDAFPGESAATALARTDVWFLLRDLTGGAADPTETGCVALTELITAAALDPACKSDLETACHERGAVSRQDRNADLATWADAATGFDLHECAYVRRDRGHILGDIAGFYRAFGVASEAAGNRRPDQLAAELEFLGLLSALQARARIDGDREAADLVRAGAAAFWTDHLACWIALPAARADYLPCPRWIKAGTRAIATVAAALAQVEGWPAPASDDQGEVDATGQVDEGSEFACAV